MKRAKPFSVVYGNAALLKNADVALNEHGETILVDLAHTETLLLFSLCSGYDFVFGHGENPAGAICACVLVLNLLHNNK